MKKLYNIFIIFLICLIIFFAFDFLQYKQECIQQKTQDKNNLYPPEKYLNFFTNEIGHTNKKPPILLFGCSFAYGTFLKNNQTFSYKLSKLTKRNVYNMALEACGIQYMYYFLSDENFYNDFSSNPPQYVIYLYIPSHLQRLTSNIFPNSLSLNGKLLLYNLKDNSLKIEKTPSVLFKSFLIKKIYIGK